MKNAIPILSILLVAQIGLALGLNHLERTRIDDKGKKILTTDLSNADQIVLENKEGNLTIKLVGKTWTLPQVYNFPAGKESVSRLLEHLKNLNGNWPVATTEAAASRFKVSATDFEERIAIEGGGKAKATVFVGSSAGYNKVHLRLDNTNDVFAVELPEREISTDSADWIDRSLVELNRDDIVSVELPQLKLTRKEKAINLTYAGKTVSVDSGTAADVLENVASIGISDVLGIEEQPEYGLAAPALMYDVVLKDGRKLKYRFGKLSNSNFYVLKDPAKGSNFFLKIDAWFIERLLKLSPETLAQKSEQMRKLRDSAIKQPIEKGDASKSP